MRQQTVYAPKGLEVEEFKDAPRDWRDLLAAKSMIAKDRTAEFLVADIIGYECVSLAASSKGISWTLIFAQNRWVALEGPYPNTPAGTNHITAWIDGEPSDTGDSMKEIVDRMRAELKDWDWPMDVTFVFWRHHPKSVRLSVD
jgi:hypothetical protein